MLLVMALLPWYRTQDNSCISFLVIYHSHSKKAIHVLLKQILNQKKYESIWIDGAFVCTLYLPVYSNGASVFNLTVYLMNIQIEQDSDPSSSSSLWQAQQSFCFRLGDIFILLDQAITNGRECQHHSYFISMQR